MQLTRTHRILAGVVVTGAVVIAAIGFAGSYAAVRELALAKGFGWFANVFPIGIDAGIVVLLALDLLLTWLRIPFPLLRQTAWLLTAATIAFNGAAAWPDPLGVGMHAIIPILFVVSVEAARHAVGRVADITADRHMESVRIARWLLAPFPTFRLWRRMKLWELRSYDEVIRLEQQRLIYQAYLRAEFGPGWKRKAPVTVLMPLRLARFGVPLVETVPAALGSVGRPVPDLFLPGLQLLSGADQDQAPDLPEHGTLGEASVDEGQAVDTGPAAVGTGLAAVTQPYAQQRAAAVADSIPMPSVRAHVRDDGEAARFDRAQNLVLSTPEPDREPVRQRLTVPEQREFDDPPTNAEEPDDAQDSDTAPPETAPQRSAGPPLTTVDRYFRAWAQYVQSSGSGTDPNGEQLSVFLTQLGFTGRGGGAVSPSTLRRYLPEFRAYAAWQHILEEQGQAPAADELAMVLAERGNIGAAYTVAKLKHLLEDFPRRRAALANDWAASNT
ncbi:DUF2637 domain-containing protein [Streptomyces sp. NBC_01262]|uniref:DUF2637 domain-containing protein n=1 Tax=Streptomyces sp. NBC_01262 TaxID=2903803 RepID=UPI002E350B89|nr:DUF2637 domain-containing protein [Streptomyces sp. NBC_01262]